MNELSLKKSFCADAGKVLKNKLLAVWCILNQTDPYNIRVCPEGGCDLQ